MYSFQESEDHLTAVLECQGVNEADILIALSVTPSANEQYQYHRDYLNHLTPLPYWATLPPKTMVIL